MSGESDSRLDLDRLFAEFEEKVFPMHGTFLLGELALFAFVGLVATGTFLALFYEPSTHTISFNGNQIPAAYVSVVQINNLPVGLLVRRIHHWSAHIMLAAIVVHMGRIYFTGAYRKPRDVNWLLGTSLLGLTVLAAFVGYLLPFDEFSVTATGIGYSIATSVPWVGKILANLLFAGPFPNPHTVPRFYSLHILLIPVLLATLIGIHVVIIIKLKHTQDGPITAELKERAGTVKDGLVGIPMWPEQVVVMIAVFFTYATLVTLLAAFVPVHPIQIYGPASSGPTPEVKPDWYLLWIYGVLRMMPPLNFSILGGSFNAQFLAGGVFPAIIGGLIAGVPFIDERVTGDAVEDPDETYIQRPSQRPGRTAIGVGAIGMFVVTGIAGYYSELGIPLNTMRAAAILVPPLVGIITYMAIKGRSQPRRRSARLAGADEGED